MAPPPVTAHNRGRAPGTRATYPIRFTSAFPRAAGIRRGHPTDKLFFDYNPVHRPRRSPSFQPGSSANRARAIIAALRIHLAFRPRLQHQCTNRPMLAASSAAPFAGLHLELDESRTSSFFDGHGRPGSTRHTRLPRRLGLAPYFGMRLRRLRHRRVDHRVTISAPHRSRCPCERGEGFHAFIPSAFLRTAFTQTDAICAGRSGWEQCPGVPPALPGLGAKAYRGTGSDKRAEATCPSPSLAARCGSSAAARRLPEVEQTHRIGYAAARKRPARR